MSSSTVSTSAKRYAARKAVELFVRSPNMKIGLGSGSTVVFVAEALRKPSVDSASVATCVPTSYQSRELILSNRLPLCDLDQNENCQLDVTIDGADEVIKYVRQQTNVFIISAISGIILKSESFNFFSVQFLSDSECLLKNSDILFDGEYKREN